MSENMSRRAFMAAGAAAGASLVAACAPKPTELTLDQARELELARDIIVPYNSIDGVLDGAEAYAASGPGEWVIPDPETRKYVQDSLDHLKTKKGEYKLSDAHINNLDFLASSISMTNKSRYGLDLIFVGPENREFVRLVDDMARVKGGKRKARLEKYVQDFSEDPRNREVAISANSAVSFMTGTTLQNGNLDQLMKHRVTVQDMLNKLPNGSEGYERLNKLIGIRNGEMNGLWQRLYMQVLLRGEGEAFYGAGSNMVQYTTAMDALYFLRTGQSMEDRAKKVINGFGLMQEYDKFVNDFKKRWFNAGQHYKHESGKINDRFVQKVQDAYMNLPKNQRDIADLIAVGFTAEKAAAQIASRGQTSKEGRTLLGYAGNFIPGGPIYHLIVEDIPFLSWQDKMGGKKGVDYNGMVGLMLPVHLGQRDVTWYRGDWDANVGIPIIIDTLSAIAQGVALYAALNTGGGGNVVYKWSGGGGTGGSGGSGPGFSGSGGVGGP